MSDITKFIHGDEGNGSTHFACAEMANSDGETHCCGCTNHKCPEPLPVTKKCICEEKLLHRDAVLVQHLKGCPFFKPFDKEKFERMAAEVKKIFEKADWEEDFRQKYEGANVWSSKSIDEIISFIQEERTQLLNAMEEIVGEDTDINKVINPSGSGAGNHYPELVDLAARGVVYSLEGANEEKQRIRSALERLRGKNTT